jgi:hypothetical protein
LWNTSFKGKKGKREKSKKVKRDKRTKDNEDYKLFLQSDGGGERGFSFLLF